jgi:hypothetical protein
VCAQRRLWSEESMKWLFLDPKQRQQRIVANPGYGVKSVLREVTWANERFLAQITGERVSRIRQFIDEPAHARVLSRRRVSW